MSVPAVSYIRPNSVQEACSHLEQAGESARPLAGGTDLLMLLKEGQRKGGLLVDLGRIPGLKEITFSRQDGLMIGALVTLAQLASNPNVDEHYPALRQAALSVASPQIRNMGTVGGNLCQETCCMYFNRPEESRKPLVPCHKLGGCVCHVVHGSQECWATYSGDLAPALLVLEARLQIAGPVVERTIPLIELFSGDGAAPYSLTMGEIVTKIEVPPPAVGLGSSYVKIRTREVLDYPLLGVATSLRLKADGTVERPPLVGLSGLDKGPKVDALTTELVGSEPTAERITAAATAIKKLSRPVRNVLGSSPRYRRAMVQNIFESAFQRASDAARNSLSKGQLG